jgi:phosphatidate cytidylyltransferase
MKQRIFSFTILWLIVTISLLIFGIDAGVWLIAALAFFTQLELYQLFDKMGLKPLKSLGVVCAPVIILSSYYMDGVDAGTDIFILCFLVLAMTIIVKDLQAGRMRSFMPTLFGLLYVPFMLHFFVKVVKLAEVSGGASYTDGTSIFLTIWIVAVAKCTDVGGLLVGMQIGKTPLSLISPQKTFEGAAGGIVFAMIIGLILLGTFHSYAPEGFTWWRSALMAIPIGIASIASDLVESAFKRQAEVKDSGHIIPGIGGIFDLTDSLILTAPLGYLMFKYFIF